MVLYLNDPRQGRFAISADIGTDGKPRQCGQRQDKADMPGQKAKQVTRCGREKAQLKVPADHRSGPPTAPSARIVAAETATSNPASGSTAATRSGTAAPKAKVAADTSPA